MARVEIEVKGVCALGRISGAAGPLSSGSVCLGLGSF
jgi:hypothetical protein